MHHCSSHLVELDSRDLARLELFREMKRFPSFATALRLRAVRAGEVVFQQASPPGPAWYAVPLDAAAACLTRHQDDANCDDASRIEQELQRIEQLGKPTEHQNPRPVAIAYWRPVRFERPKPPGRMSRWFGNAPPSPAVEPTPPKIAHDGPDDIDSQTQQTAILEADLFGEASCLNDVPRSATVVADADCYLLEIPRELLAEMQRDTGFQRRAERVYRQRRLRHDIRNVAELKQLTEGELDELASLVELDNYQPGEVICDSHDPVESIAIVRDGTVRVMDDCGFMLAADDIDDWPEFCRQLVAANPE